MDAVGRLLLLAFLAIAAYTDCGARRIPNRLNAAGAGVGLIWAFLVAWPDDGPWIGLLIGAGSMLLLYVMNGVGGGDVKLMAGVGLLAGYPLIVYYLFYGCIAAFILIVAPRAWRGEFFKRAKSPATETVPAGTGVIHAKRETAEVPTDTERVHGPTTSFALALLLGVVWVWIMEAM